MSNNKLFEKLIFISLFTFSLPNISFSSSCFNSKPYNDSKYKYLVGKGYSKSSTSEAFKEAEQDINTQLSRLFGTELNVQTEYYSDDRISSGVSRTKERTLGNIRIKGLERIDEDVKKQGKLYVGCVQYKYSNKEYELEKNRLSKINFREDDDFSLNFNESNGDTSCPGSSLSITTNPKNAFVSIDNGKYQGQSPIKFANVCNGRHTLYIMKDGYEDVEEVLITPMTNKIIKKKLEKSSKTITIATNLGNSKIFVNGKNYGTEPVKFKAFTGVKYEIGAENKIGKTIKKEEVFYKESNDSLVLNLDKKPSRIDFTAFKKKNKDVEIYVNGDRVRDNITKDIDTDRENFASILFKKSGYNDITDQIKTTPGEVTYYPIKELVFYKDFNPYRDNGKDTKFGISIGSNTQTYFTLDVFGEFRNGFLYQRFALLGDIGHFTVKKEDGEFKGVKEDLGFIEFLSYNLGINLGRSLSIFGLVSLGFVDNNVYMDKGYKSMNSAEEELIAFGMYGGGIQLNISRDFSFRFTYKRGTIKNDVYDTYDNCSSSSSGSCNWYWSRYKQGRKVGELKTKFETYALTLVLNFDVK